MKTEVIFKIFYDGRMVLTSINQWNDDSGGGDLGDLGLHLGHGRTRSGHEHLVFLRMNQ